MTWDQANWTYGAEHEFGDWDRAKPLPPGFKVDERDVTIVNSNGIAVDPKARHYGYGGEINTPPTDTPQGQGLMLELLLQAHPNCVVNYRSNLHCHIRVPGLRDDLSALKRIARYNQGNLKSVLPLIEPIPDPRKDKWRSEDELKGAMRRYRRRKKSHHTTLTHRRFVQQQLAKTVEEFFEAEVPKRRKDGVPQWHLAARCAVNLRQLRETDTIEFRHFPGTLNPGELVTCLEWCRDYLWAALVEDVPAEQIFLERFRNRKFPTFPRYDHTLEKRYRATCHDGSVPKTDIAHYIHEILEGKFDDTRPCGLPR